ncbi:MAG: DNA polymerase III subunit gamma/tau, partial [Desulfobacterales bacterium]|nr:DNA polymerase III subunit gamma/tau [Desulfobacterales bacterium]
MAYLVFARKYRPQQFDDVIGQAHITRSLANAVTTRRLAHAILFSGPRGTGKTTVARILAKCVNCHNGPTDKPCNQCPSCREITTSSAADVFEIDGASNNKVENVRELRETAKYKPSSSPYKIFIIDEVHMLSDAAFNALLKTLEEPPAHVLFFFATTEPNKIPVTILSRCQRYDFRRVAIDDITAHMAEICRQEQMQISENALAVIAREADGSIRDGLSLLDQIVTCSSGQVSDEQVVEMLGVIDRQVLFDAADALFSGNAAALVGICDALYRQGRHLLRFYSELIVHFRNLLLIKMGGAEKSLTDVPEHEKKQMAKQVEPVSEPYLSQIVNTLFSDEWRIRQSISPRHALEMTFFKLLQIRPAMSMDTLIEKLDQLR